MRNNSGSILYAALPTLDVYHVSTTEPTCFPRNGSRQDILDSVLVKGVTITERPQAIFALDSDHIPVYLSIHYLHFPDSRELPSIYNTDWDRFTQLLVRTTDCNRQLNSPEDIEHTVDLITPNIKSALYITTI